MKFGKVIIVGCVKNSEKFLPNVFQNLEKITDLYNESAFIFIENDSIVREFYDYLMNIKDMDKFDKLPLPVTEHQKNLSELSVSVIEQFIKDWTIENFDNKERIKIFSSTEFYECFVEWREKNKIKYVINVLKLMCRLKNSNINGITKKITKIQSFTVFNVDDLINHFNIIDIDENED